MPVLRTGIFFEQVVLVGRIRVRPQPFMVLSLTLIATSSGA
jgi:hypothetical protein